MPVVIPVEITTVGAKVKYCVETTPGVRPTTGYTELVGVSSAPALDMTVETIDVSDLSDTITQYVPGRQDPGGDLQFTLNHSDEAIDGWNDMYDAAADGLAEKKRMWIEYFFPGATYSYFYCARPLKLGNGGIEQNAADTIPAHVVPNGEFGWLAQSTDE